VRHSDSEVRDFDTSCFSGEYVTGDVSTEYLRQLEKRRSDSAKAERNGRMGDDPQQGELTSVPFGEEDADDDDASESAVGM
jgi:amidophosphoribosyltransferase